MSKYGYYDLSYQPIIYYSFLFIGHKVIDLEHIFKMWH